MDSFTVFAKGVRVGETLVAVVTGEALSAVVKGVDMSTQCEP